MVRFQSRCKDAALLNAAFEIQPNGDYVRRVENHPMRYWVVAGWGPVPTALRAPNAIYKGWDDELVFSNSVLSEGTTMRLRELYEGAATWTEEYLLLNLIRDCRHSFTRWIGVVDVRDDGSTTVENLTTAPEGSDEIVSSLEESKTFCAPIDTATGRAYFEVTSGDFAVIGQHNQQYISVGNVACGKWFWQIHDFGENWQLVLWNESVDDNGKYKIPYCDNSDDLKEYLDLHRVDQRFGPNELPYLRTRRAAALTASEAFLRLADVEPLLKDKFADFMTVDPDGLWWKTAELPDGFLEATCMTMAWRLVVCDANSIFNKFHFESSLIDHEVHPQEHMNVRNKWLADQFPKKENASTWAVPGGCALRPPNKSGWLQFRLHNRTKKIVVARLVLR